jgi:hypothetical protein
MSHTVHENLAYPTSRVGPLCASLTLVAPAAACETSTTDLTEGESGGNNRVVYRSKHRYMNGPNNKQPQFHYNTTGTPSRLIALTELIGTRSENKRIAFIRRTNFLYCSCGIPMHRPLWTMNSSS